MSANDGDVTKVNAKKTVKDKFCNRLTTSKTVIQVCKTSEQCCKIDVLGLHHVFALTVAVLVLKTGDVHDDGFACIVQADEQQLFVTTQRFLDHFKQEF